MWKQLKGLLCLNRDDLWIALGLTCGPLFLVHLVTNIVMIGIHPRETIMIGGMILPFSAGLAAFAVTTGNCQISFSQAIQFGCTRKRARLLVLGMAGILTLAATAAAFLLLAFERLCAMSVWRALSGNPGLLLDDFGFAWWSIPLGAAIGFLLGLLYAALLLRFGAKGVWAWMVLWFGGLAGMQALPWKTHEVTNVLFPVLGIAAVLAVVWSLWIMGRHCLTK